MKLSIFSLILIGAALATVNAIVTRRVQNEITRLKKDPLPGISVGHNQYELNKIEATLWPTGGKLENAIEVVLLTSVGYPLSAPEVQVITEINQPEVDKCLDLIRDSWMPAIQIRHVLLSIQTVLNEPNADINKACNYQV